MTHGLTDGAVEKIREVLSRHEKIEAAILYGSRVLETFRKGSDIDLTLVGDALGYADLLKIDRELDDLLLPNVIDLSLLSEIDNRALIEHIQHAGVTLYDRNTHFELHSSKISL